MKKLTKIIILIPSLYLSQVGINTTTPTKTLDVNGEVRIRTLPQGDINDSILVVDSEGNIKKVAVSTINNSGICPTFVKNQSNPHYLLFISASSIPNPNNSLVINGINFVSAGTWISNNIYYYSYSNTSSTPLTASTFVVNFGSIGCSYTN